MLKKIKSLSFFFLIAANSIQAQDAILDQEITLDKITGTTAGFLTEISEKGGFTFTYSNQIPLEKRVTLRGKKQSVRSLLDQLFAGKVEYLVSNNKIILTLKIPLKKVRKNFTINGYIRDESSGEVLFGATVFAEELSTGIAANAYGFYSITMPEGNYTLSFSFIGYQTQTLKIELKADLTIDIALKALTTELEEIEIAAESEEKNVGSLEISTHKLSPETIDNMPALGGSPDIIKSLQALPGVTTLGEGSTGFFVRGGGRGENLILLDEAPIYNPSHLLGFVSVFNTDAINNVTFYKGGIPARYGGRGSSILDIRMKEGSTKKFGAMAALSPLGGGKMTLEAPIRQGKGSFIVSGRRTYIDPIFWLASRIQPEIEGTRLFFYDFNAKANYTFDDKNKLFVSGYFGRDVNRLPILDFDIRWGNQTGTLRWNHIFNNKLFSNFTLIYSSYNYKLDIPSAELPFGWESRIRDINFNADFTLFANPTTTLNFGLNIIHHHFDPGSNRFDPQLDVPNSNALEHGAFLSLEKEIGNSVLLELGMRWSLFQNIGKTTLFKFDNNFLPTDTINYQAGRFYNSYHQPEPRLSIRFLMDNNQSFKVSYNRMVQYLHMLANSSLSFTAFDVWYPSGPNIEPLIVDQLAFGYFKNFSNNRVEVSLEGYYKNIDNQIDYKDFAQVTFNPLLEGELRRGRAWSYGLEFFLKKKAGKLTGWLSYTWSRAIHKVPGINDNRSFPAIYDQPHKIATTASYQLSKKLTLGANWTYNTGAPITLPTEGYDYGGSTVPVPIYTSRNDSRLPDYHRLDLSLKLNPRKNESRKIKIEYVFTVYNAYNRLNALSVYVGEDLAADANPQNPRTVANKITLLPILPTISFLFKL